MALKIEIENIINAAMDIQMNHATRCRCRLCEAVKSYIKSKKLNKPKALQPSNQLCEGEEDV